jgi:hypothetical protein
MTISPTMYRAICEIAENGERLPAHELNVDRRTVGALARRGFITVDRGHAFVTDRAWAALA